MVGLLGMRQTGKTTLARQFAANRAEARVHAFDLENPADVARLTDPLLALEPLRGLVILDEIQHRPELFPVLRVLADRPRTPARFLVLGSASPDLLRQTSESLAGRISYLRVEGFGIDEVSADQRDRLWIRGGLPRSFLARSDADSREWRENFIDTFLTRDVPQLGISTPATTLRRFWSMLAHYHGQIWNGSEFARSFGVSHTTVRRYLDQLTATFAVEQLQPWHENLRKRQVKSPKVYLSDSGILHALLGLTEQIDVERHPKLGASWEGFMLQQVVRRLGARRSECYFWATQAGAELDLLIVRGRHRIGFEFKRSSAPSVTPSMRIAMQDLGLDRLEVVHAGSETFPLGKGLRAVAASRLKEDLAALK